MKPIPAQPVTHYRAFQWSTDSQGRPVILLYAADGRGNGISLTHEQTVRLRDELLNLIPVS